QTAAADGAADADCGGADTAGAGVGDGSRLGWDAARAGGARAWGPGAGGRGSRLRRMFKTRRGSREAGMAAPVRAGKRAGGGGAGGGAFRKSGRSRGGGRRAGRFGDFRQRPALARVHSGGVTDDGRERLRKGLGRAQAAHQFTELLDVLGVLFEIVRFTKGVSG